MKKCNRTYKKLFAGSLAGAIAKTATYPLDRVKMTLQVGNTTDKVILLIRNEGLVSLWKGNLTALTRTFPQAGVAFASFDSYNAKFSNIIPHGYCQAMAGAAAGLTATLATYPLDVWNTRMAVSTGQIRYVALADKAIKAERIPFLVPAFIRSTYRGVIPTLAGSIPYAACSFWIYSVLTKLRLDQTAKTSLSPRDNLCIGGVAGAMSQTLTYPIDTVRKRIQAHAALHPSERCPSSIVVFRNIFRMSGMRGFYNGVSLNWIKGFLAAGIAYTLNEKIKLFINS